MTSTGVSSPHPSRSRRFPPLDSTVGGGVGPGTGRVEVGGGRSAGPSPRDRLFVGSDDRPRRGFSGTSNPPSVLRPRSLNSGVFGIISCLFTFLSKRVFRGLDRSSTLGPWGPKGPATNGVGAGVRERETARRGVVRIVPMDRPNGIGTPGPSTY